MVRKSESFRESTIGSHFRLFRGMSIPQRHQTNGEEDMRNEYPMVEIVEIFSDAKTVV